MNIKFSNPKNMPIPHGYSQVVEYSGGGKIVFISGQVGADKTGNIDAAGSLEDQARQTFNNIKHGVEAAGGKMADVVKLNSYLKDITQIAILRSVRDTFVNTDCPPASTTIQTVFDDDHVLVEIDATAIIPL